MGDLFHVNHVVVIQKVISLIQKIMVIPVNMTYNDGDDDDDDEAWSLKLEAWGFKTWLC